MKSDNIQKDLIEQLDQYSKHYYLTNNELIKQANQFWSEVHEERT